MSSCKYPLVCSCAYCSQLYRNNAAGHNYTNSPTPTILPKANEQGLPEDKVNHPKHYTSSEAKCTKCNHPIECIDVTRHMSFNIGNVIKYLWRTKLKNGLEDLKKARWYLDDQIKQEEAKTQVNYDYQPKG